MSHHYSGPNVGFPHGDPRLDLTDLYVFPKPGSPSKSILIMNVHPSSSLVPVAPTRRDPFAADALYEIKIDTNGDAVADIAYRMRFSPFSVGMQTATLRRVQGAEAARTADSGEIILQGAPVSLGNEAIVTDAGDLRFFAGWRSDPFFFDPLGTINNFQYSGRDFFTDKDVCSIVLELPNFALGSEQIGLWARTVDGTSGSWIQADRGARPAQSIFLTGDAKEAYLAAEPADDARFVAVFAHSLEHSGGYAPDAASRIAATLLPDIMRFAPGQPASYPSNGRALQDDVLDPFLSMLTNGKVTSDGVGPHDNLLTVFPYLAPPFTHRA